MMCVCVLYHINQLLFKSVDGIFANVNGGFNMCVCAYVLVEWNTRPLFWL